MPKENENFDSDSDSDSDYVPGECGDDNDDQSHQESGLKEMSFTKKRKADQLWKQMNELDDLETKAKFEKSLNGISNQKRKVVSTKKRKAKNV